MKKRTTMWLLLAAMLAALLSGCGENADAAQAEEDEFASKYAFRTEYVDLDLGENVRFLDIAKYCISGDNAFFGGSCKGGATKVILDSETGEPLKDPATGAALELDSMEINLFRLDLNTHETVRLDADPVELPDTLLENEWLLAMAAGQDGTFWTAELWHSYSYNLPENFDAEHDTMDAYYVSGDFFLLLIQYSADGQQLRMLDVSEQIGGTPSQMLVDENGYFYLNDNNYGLIYLLDSEGVLLAELENTSASDLFQISGTEVGLFEYGTDLTVHLIDAAGKRYGEDLTLPMNVRTLYPGVGDYRYLYRDWNSVVWGYREETGASERLFSWLECNVDQSQIGDFQMMEDGHVAAVIRNYSTAQYGMVVMEPVDPSTLPEKVELTLATMSANNVSRAVLEFNRSHSDVRIVVKDYSQYNTSEDMSAGLTRLNTEILAGNAPDILCTFDLPVEQYAARGILTDLWPLIDGDEDLSRDDLMTHLFDVLSIDGKLYQVADSFMIWTAVGDANVIGDRTGWTMEELQEIIQAMPDSSKAFGTVSRKSTILSFCTRMNLNRFIDWDAQTCSFDSQEFQDILRFANSFPAEYIADASETTYDRFQEGTQLLYNTLIAGFDEMQVLSALVGGNPCYVGYPSSTGSGSAFSVNSGLAITAACQDVDAAWSFLRTLLTEDYQTENITNHFPTNRHAFDALAQEAMTPVYGIDLTTGRNIETPRTYWQEEGMEIKVYALSQEDYDRFMRLYESCDSLWADNDFVLGIIYAETEPFFDGQKTMEEVIALIQDRVGLYVMEQK